MLRFLFWNLNKQPIAGLVAKLAHERRSDVVILAENAIPNGEVERRLRRETGAISYRWLFDQVEGLDVFTRIRKADVKGAVDVASPRFTAREFHSTEFGKILLIAVHLPSRTGKTIAELAHLATRFRIEIEQLEKRARHRNTIVVGDFNMNPFEEGALSSEGLHAVMTAQVALGESRKVSREERHFLYNPMWGLFGDASSGPAGTYYYADGGPICQYWHMFDQVLMRPGLIARFVRDELSICESVGEQSLLTAKGLPNRSSGSDHLPITFAFDV